MNAAATNDDEANDDAEAAANANANSNAHANVNDDVKSPLRLQLIARPPLPSNIQMFIIVDKQVRPFNLCCRGP